MSDKAPFEAEFEIRLDLYYEKEKTDSEIDN